MAMLYADRAFISVNGAQLADVQSCTLKQNKNAKAVGTMTPDRFNRGFVQGNVDIEISLSLAVQNGLARPKLESIPFDTADVQLTFIRGQDQFVAHNLFIKDVEDAASGIGEEGKVNYNFGALKLLDAVGNSVLFNIGL